MQIPTGYYRTILIDPPWQQTMSGKYRESKQKRAASLPYATMTIDQIQSLPVASLAASGCHLWLWTTNQYLRHGFDLMEAWGFRYLAPITWVKPSGMGNWFVHRTQTLLMGYRDKCQFNAARYRPTVLDGCSPVRHSQKPSSSYDLIESVSDEPRVELFARSVRPGWDAWGNEVPSTICDSSQWTQHILNANLNPLDVLL